MHITITGRLGSGKSTVAKLIVAEHGYTYYSTGNITRALAAEAGIGIAFVSNNDWERVELFNATLGVPAYAKSGKPFKKNLVKAMNDLGGTLETTVMLGDQLLTDALAGHNLGVKCLIVPPIRDKKNAFFKFKRWLEKPVVKKFKRRNGIEW